VKAPWQMYLIIDRYQVHHYVLGRTEAAALRKWSARKGNEDHVSIKLVEVSA
jgi:hypothetical protein